MPTVCPSCGTVPQSGASEDQEYLILVNPIKVQAVKSIAYHIYLDGCRILGTVTGSFRKLKYVRKDPRIFLLGWIMLKTIFAVWLIARLGQICAMEEMLLDVHFH